MTQVRKFLLLAVAAVALAAFGAPAAQADEPSFYLFNEEIEPAGKAVKIPVEITEDLYFRVGSTVTWHCTASGSGYVWNNAETTRGEGEIKSSTYDGLCPTVNPIGCAVNPSNNLGEVEGPEEIELGWPIELSAGGGTGVQLAVSDIVASGPFEGYCPGLAGQAHWDGAVTGEIEPAGEEQLGSECVEYDNDLMTETPYSVSVSGTTCMVYPNPWGWPGITVK